MPHLIGAIHYPKLNEPDRGPEGKWAPSWAVSLELSQETHKQFDALLEPIHKPGMSTPKILTDKNGKVLLALRRSAENLDQPVIMDRFGVKMQRPILIKPDTVCDAWFSLKIWASRGTTGISAVLEGLEVISEPAELNEPPPDLDDEEIPW